MELDFFKNKKIFITGHTGFKGSWLCRILVNQGAVVTGYSQVAPTQPNLFEIADIEKDMDSIIGDVRDLSSLNSAFERSRPEIVIHLAAQPIVRDGYQKPVCTYETNVMGTVNILECVRKSKSVKSFLNVTTDKVYKNNEWEWGYREDEPLDGFDPYSNSKSCSELVTHSYKNSFFQDNRVAISTARAGNVIGGGDFANDRIIPDCVRSAKNHETIIVRNPYSIRPYQHVLDPLFAYLMILHKQHESTDLAGYYNVGPEESDCITTGDLVDMFCTKWGEDQDWRVKVSDGPHESKFLKLDCSRLKTVFGWKPRWSISDAVDKTIQWTKGYFASQDVLGIMDKQIHEFLNR